MEGPLVRVENLEKVYTIGKVSVHALRGVNLTLGKGEFVVIMGPSGSGKTTLLNLIGALDRPTKGMVLVDGLDIAQLGEKDLTKLRRGKIGFIFQFYNLIPVLTAYENVELPLLISGKPRSLCRERAMGLLRTVGLETRAHHRPDELSGGEQQRVAIARSLANNPSLILADEPTGDLDTKTGTEIIEVLKDATKREGVTVVVVTHDPVVAERADRIIEMRDGTIQREKIRPNHPPP